MGGGAIASPDEGIVGTECENQSPCDGRVKASTAPSAVSSVAAAALRIPETTAGHDGRQQPERYCFPALSINVPTGGKIRAVAVYSVCHGGRIL